MICIFGLEISLLVRLVEISHQTRSKAVQVHVQFIV